MVHAFVSHTHSVFTPLDLINIFYHILDIL